MKKYRILFLLLLILLTVSACRERIKTFDLTVQVLSHELPVAGAEVRIHTSGSKTTNTAGLTYFAGLVEREYQLTVKRSGFSDHVVNLYLHKDLGKVTINLDNHIEPPAWLKISIGNATLTLEWAKVENSNLAKYRIYRSTDGLTFDLLAEPVLSDTRYVDQNVVNGQIYYYRMEAIDRYGEVSVPSQVEYATPYLPLTYHLLYSKMNYLYRTFDLYLTAEATETNLTQTVPNELCNDYFKERNEILYTSDESGKEQIYKLSLDSRIATRLTYLPDGATSPVYSPDGSEIIYQNLTNGSLYRINADGTNARELTKGQDPDWSSTGDLLFVAKDAEGVDNLFSISPDGSNKRQLTYYKTSVKRPRWSPDGAKIVYIQNRQVMVANADGSQGIMLTNLLCDYVDSPIWSPDENSIFYVSNDNPQGIPAIYRKEVDSGTDGNGELVIGYGFQPIAF